MECFVDQCVWYSAPVVMWWTVMDVPHVDAVSITLFVWLLWSILYYVKQQYFCIIMTSWQCTCIGITCRFRIGSGSWYQKIKLISIGQLVTPHNSIFMTGQYHNLPHLSSAPSKTPVQTTLLTLTTKVFFSKFLICPFQDQERQPKVHPGLKPLSMLSANHWTALILRAQRTVSHLKTNL